MEIVDFQHTAIQSVFPSYNREKSKIIVEFGNEVSMAFVAHIYRKGKFSFEIKDGKYHSHKKVA